MDIVEPVLIHWISAVFVCRGVYAFVTDIIDIFN